MKMSCSARKDLFVHIRDWIGFQKSHAKIHGKFDFNYTDIDYIFGFTEIYSPLYGGRINKPGEYSISRQDEYWAYDNGIGLKLPLSVKRFSEEQYTASLPLLQEYHRVGNAIILSNNELASRIKEDFPLYKLEASAIMDIDSKESFNRLEDTNLYDNIVLPLHMNDDLDMIKSLSTTSKSKLRLFINMECSYTCPKKICYTSMTQVSEGKRDTMKCSHYDLHLPRTYYNDNINWRDSYFSIERFKEVGVSNFKILGSVPEQQRIEIMLETNKWGK
jgi:hypothetical protein